MSRSATPPRARPDTQSSIGRPSMMFWLLTAALVVVTLGGGSNRTDVVSLLYVRPALVVVLAIMALFVHRGDLITVRWPIAILLAVACLGAVQLVPLPPAVWMSLPGREIVAKVGDAMGASTPWAPVSLSPDLTWQSLLWCLSPACALLGWALLPSEDRGRFVTVLVGFLVIGALLGGLQASQGSGPLYLYSATYEGFGVGFFANRNHQGALLAAAFPVLRLWTLLPGPSSQSARRRMLIVLAAYALLVPLLLLTGSRAGLGLALVGLVFALAMAPVDDIRANLGKRMSGSVPLMLIAGTIVLLGAAALAIGMGRGLAVSRLMEVRVRDDLRVAYAPHVYDLAKKFFPVGSGLGSFDTVFRMFEPDSILKPTYFNHAHNDIVEAVIDGGIVALAIMIAAAIWLCRAAYHAFATMRGADPAAFLPRAGCAVVVILALASIVDYPLRTPLGAFVFSLAVAWLATVRSAGQAAAQEA